MSGSGALPKFIYLYYTLGQLTIFEARMRRLRYKSSLIRSRILWERLSIVLNYLCKVRSLKYYNGGEYRVAGANGFFCGLLYERKRTLSFTLYVLTLYIGVLSNLSYTGVSHIDDILCGVLKVGLIPTVSCHYEMEGEITMEQSS